jgi:RND family efflux transporter MFP subunit
MSDGKANMGQLLDELRLDKTAPSNQTSSKARWFWLTLVVATGAIVLSTGAGGLLPGQADNNDKLNISTAEATQKPLPAKTTQSSTDDEKSAPDIPAQSQGTDLSPLDATGYFYAKRQATVSSQTTGLLTKIHVEEGDVVKAGSLIAELDDSLLRAQFELAKSQLKSKEHSLVQTEVLLQEARSRFVRTEKMTSQKLSSTEKYENDRYAVLALEARLARDRSEIDISRRQIAIQQQMLNRSLIYAPFEGVVIEQSAQIGEIVSPVSAGGGYTRTGICTLVDLSSLEGEVLVNERFIERVYQGQQVTVTAHAYPQLKVPGKVSAIMPSVNKETAAIKVRISLDERDDRLLPNMGIDVSFSEAALSSAIMARSDIK